MSAALDLGLAREEVEAAASRERAAMLNRDPVRAHRLLTRVSAGCAGDRLVPASMQDAIQIADDIRVVGGYFTRVCYPEVTAWLDSGLRVFEVAKHAAHELLLTRPPGPGILRPPVTAFAVKLSADGSCPVPGADVGFVFVWNTDLEEGQRTADAYVIGKDHAEYLAPTAGVSYQAVSRGGTIVAPHPAIDALVGNLIVAVTCRQDDLVCETLQVRRTAAVRPSISRVRMHNPRVDLAPHVQRFVLEGERAFSSKRGHQVLGFFRRPPGGEQKTVWVRPHFRGGKLSEATEPRFVDVVRGATDE